MFGYITPEKPELKVREYDLFRAVYCGICKSIGKSYGLIPKATITYDAAFLALLLAGVTGSGFHTANGRCMMHPLKKRCFAVNNEISGYVSEMNIIMAYHNLVDKWKDDKNLPALGLKMMLGHTYKRLKKKYPVKCRIFQAQIDALQKLENEKCCSMDKAAEPTGRIFEELVDPGSPGMACGNREALRWLGYNTGKWIYLIDAYDDLEEDIRKSKYNPLALQFGFKGGDPEGFRLSIRERVEFNLTHTLSQITKAYDILDIRCNSGIIENIIYLGMLRKTENILGAGSCKKS